MFHTHAQINEIKNIARKCKIRVDEKAPPDYLAFKIIESLLKRMDSLEKEVKELTPDD